MEPLIKMKNITKDFYLGEVVVNVLRGMDLTLGRGEFVSVMGPSGAGKTTLMNLIGCLDTPTGGEYIFNGSNIAALNDADLSEFRNQTIGYVFQAFYLIPQYNVLENVLLPALYTKDKKVKDLRERAREVIKQVGLSDRIKHTPSQLSGGQRQRVAIARALLMDPALLLADEPTGNLDSRTSAEILDIINHLHTEGRSIVIITHEDFVASCAERIIHLKDGMVERVEEAGKTCYNSDR